MTRRLLVTVPDRVSDWADKGEIVDRYFNPGDLFDHIDLLLTNDDAPQADALARLAGRATITVHNVPAPRWLFVATLGWRPVLLRPWARRVVAIARELKPDLVRCHGVQVNLFGAARVREVLGVPLVVSLHGNPDVDELRGRRGSTRALRLVGRLMRTVERYGLRRSDVAIAVYEPIVSYLQEIGVRRYEVIYNAVGERIRPKDRWDLASDGPLVINVARQWPDQKDPRPIVEAVAALPGVRLLLVGRGPLHEEVLHAIERSGAADRITAVETMPNAFVLDAMRASDIFAYASDNHELSKGCIEAALTGLPIVANDRSGDPAPELVGGHIRLVDGSAASFRDAIDELVRDAAGREKLGRAALGHARRHWSPVENEARVAALYRELMGVDR